jgi:hypothetical protein
MADYKNADMFLRSFTDDLIPKVYPGLKSDEDGRNFTELLPSFGAFDENQKYVFTPEGNKFKEDFKKLSNKELEIKTHNDPAGGGLYRPYDKDGGHLDPNKRTIYIAPTGIGNSPEIIAHEAGHSIDPNIQQNAKYINNAYQARTPSELLNAHLKTTNFNAEVEAQRAAVDLLNRNEIPTGGIRSDSWFKNYPASYIDKGIQETNRFASSYPIPNQLKPFAQDVYAQDSKIINPLKLNEPSVQIFDFNDRRAKGMLNLGLNQKYQDTIQETLKRARSYIDQKLGT